MLGQIVDLVEHVIYFISKSLQGIEFNYIVIEKKRLKIINALNNPIRDAGKVLVFWIVGEILIGADDMAGNDHDIG